MKRSEMIKKMSDCFNTCKVMGYTDKGAMDRVLELCEENGMLPPDNCSIKCHEYNYETCGNVWEPEDDDNSDKYCGAV